MIYANMPWRYALIFVFLFACLVGCVAEAFERWKLDAPRRVERKLRNFSVGRDVK